VLQQHSEAHKASPNRVLTERETAERLGLSVSYLRKLRYLGGGPAYIQLTSRRIGYREWDADAWVAARRVAPAA
jgi:predicted DNA-binding transcriptional regulator AlpA